MNNKNDKHMEQMDYIFEKFEKTNGGASALPYEFLKEHEVCKCIIDDSVRIWREIGFTDLVEDEEKERQMAVGFTNLALACLNDDYRVEDIKLYLYDKYSDVIDFDVIAFPILRKVVMEVDNFSFDNFLEFFAIAKYYTIDEEIEDYLYDEDFDYEAELCAMLADTIIAQFKRIKED